RLHHDVAREIGIADVAQRDLVPTWQQAEPVATLQLFHVTDVLPVDPHPRQLLDVAGADELELAVDVLVEGNGRNREEQSEREDRASQKKTRRGHGCAPGLGKTGLPRDLRQPCWVDHAGGKKFRPSPTSSGARQLREATQRLGGRANAESQRGSITKY